MLGFSAWVGLISVSSMRSAFTCSVRLYCQKTGRYLSFFIKLRVASRISVSKTVTSAFQVGTVSLSLVLLSPSFLQIDTLLESLVAFFMSPNLFILTGYSGSAVTIGVRLRSFCHGVVIWCKTSNFPPASAKFVQSWTWKACPGLKGIQAKVMFSHFLNIFKLGLSV
jgi:hypothetical protein